MVNNSWHYFFVFFQKVDGSWGICDEVEEGIFIAVDGAPASFESREAAIAWSEQRQPSKVAA